MAWTTPRTWTTAELVTAANMNTYISDNLSYLYSNIPPSEIGVSQTVNNTNVETTLGTVTVAAGTLGTTGLVWGETALRATQASGGAMNFTWRVKLGATTFFAPVVSQLSAANYIYLFRYVISNNASASAQHAIMQIYRYDTASASSSTLFTWSIDNGMYNTGTENTANAAAFAFTGQMASAHASGYIYHMGTRLWAPLT